MMRPVPVSSLNFLVTFFSRAVSSIGLNRTQGEEQSGMSEAQFIGRMDDRV